MRIETVRTWLLVGLLLQTAGMFLYMLEATADGRPAIFLAAVGFVYFMVGAVLSLVHDKHMAKRTRAGRE
jgi:hypothetical protein